MTENRLRHIFPSNQDSKISSPELCYAFQQLDLLITNDTIKGWVSHLEQKIHSTNNRLKADAAIEELRQLYIISESPIVKDSLKKYKKSNEFIRKTRSFFRYQEPRGINLENNTEFYNYCSIFCISLITTYIVFGILCNLVQ